MKKLYFITLIGFFFVSKGLVFAQKNPYQWPKVNKESRTWTRWWWMGSAVDKKNITRSLIAFEKAGIGGVEIEPIYGVKGKEKNFIDFLSPYWIEMLNYDKGRRQLTNGSGLDTWNWLALGRKNVSLVDAAKRILLEIEAKKGTLFSERVHHSNRNLDIP